ncbi:hypothetical protein SKAU_G00084650 [Synaphobranchus kaupii]|uniref:Uncharacterized protein n=1 Tax=Synaphobranchus kaupii TaxID=118154 RepID=A0A9Q1FVU8_SYNKA|nr:hypothetical protein SKAU_G00084650 [Synaphobranchus kaupii]
MALGRSSMPVGTGRMKPQIYDAFKFGRRAGDLSQATAARSLLELLKRAPAPTAAYPRAAQPPGVLGVVRPHTHAHRRLSTAHAATGGALRRLMAVITGAAAPSPSHRPCKSAESRT